MIKEFIFALSLIRKSLAGDYRGFLGHLSETRKFFSEEVFTPKRFIPFVLMVIAFTPLAIWITLIVIRVWTAIPVPQLIVNVPSVLLWGTFLGIAIAFAKLVSQAEGVYDRTNHDPCTAFDEQDRNDRRTKEDRKFRVLVVYSAAFVFLLVSSVFFLVVFYPQIIPGAIDGILIICAIIVCASLAVYAVLDLIDLFR